MAARKVVDPLQDHAVVDTITTAVGSSPQLQPAFEDVDIRSF